MYLACAFIFLNVNGIATFCKQGCAGRSRWLECVLSSLLCSVLPSVFVERKVYTCDGVVPPGCLLEMLLPK